MQALLLTDYRKIELRSLDRPTIGPDDALVAIKACGICGSDVHGYDGSSGRRVPPIVMGHEAAGVVAKVGSNVRTIKPGDEVAIDSTISCGGCAACLRGNVNLCAERRVLGVSCGEYRQYGAFADYVSVPARILYRLPRGVPFEHAAMVEPVTIALHAVSRVRVAPGCSAVVVGAGAIGLLVIQALKLAGCKDVISIDVDDSRLRLAAELGAQTIINPTREEPVVKVLELTDGSGAEIAMEVVGNAGAFATAIGCVCRGGQVGLVGNVTPEVPLPLQTVVTRELTLLGSCASAGEYPRAIELIATGAIRVAPLLTAVSTLATGPEWFERLYAREPGLMKVVLCPTGQENPDG
ncbi:MAG TPA: galactitol-1-phosphate 5-dehydrogenase [Lacipirellulaceae bacterium]|jgi:L-iditol 2-dehydrogenase